MDPRERAAVVVASEQRCPRCNARREADQEYCIECGLRLPPVSDGAVASLRKRWLRRLGWYPGDWVWPSLVALAIAAAGAAVAVALTRDGSAGGGTTIVLTTTFPLGAQPTPQAPTMPREAPPEPDTGLTPLPPPSRPSPPGRFPWPEDRNGWTVVLISYPARDGRGSPDATALRAANAGLPEVGVLESSGFTSLQPGYHVVFSGLYSSRGDAEAALSSAQAAGFGGAYVRQIAR